MKSTITLFVTLAASAFAFAGELRLNGASTTVNGLINPLKSAVEASTGTTLKVAGTNTGKGLVALIDGQADVALTSEPLDIAISAAKAAGKDLNAADFQIHAVKEDYVLFVVHPSNPVTSLTHDQIKAIHTGKIANWKEVGGADMPIVVFTDAVTGGTRALIKKLVLDGEDYGAACKPLESVRFVATSVSELKNGFGGVGAGFVDATKVKAVKSDVVPRPLGFITKGAPTPEVQKMIAAFKAEAKK
jgi:phosphate transport system substrate-binding protein